LFGRVSRYYIYNSIKEIMLSTRRLANVNARFAKIPTVSQARHFSYKEPIRPEYAQYIKDFD